MRSRRWIAALFVVAAVGGIAVTAWPAAASRKPLVLHIAPPVRLPIIRTVRGPARPHDFDLSMLLPRHTRLRQVWFLDGSSRRDRILVEWIRAGHASLRGTFRPSVQWGLTLWTEAPRRRAYLVPWRAVAIPVVRFPPAPTSLRVAFADVTGDGRPDVLVEQYPGTNHGCGPHEAVAMLAHRSTWRTFRSNLCETTLHGDHGLLALDMPYYLPGDSVCCARMVEHLRLRWNGRRYTTAALRIVRAGR